MKAERTCRECGIVYHAFPSIRLQFCSKQCSDKSRRTGQSIKCAVCLKEVWSHPSRPRQYCSKSCARTALNLTPNNPSFTRDLSGENNPMFGRGLAGKANPMFGKRREQSPNWKGGRKRRKDGYILVVAPDDHPNPCDYHAPSGLKYILEHRLVMEKHLGRYLKPEEVVHHKDENTSNNSIENLQLFANLSEHMRIGHGKKTVR